MDEALGLWSELEEVFGAAAVKRSGSCEWHYSQSYKAQAKFLKSGGCQYERYASEMLFAARPDDYEKALVKIEYFIEEDRNERAHIYTWLAWWDQRRSHFSRAYKNSSAPSTNLSEGYNSKYVTSNQVNLKLIDAAK